MQLPRIQPMRLRLVREALDDPDFIFELKHGGFQTGPGLSYLDCVITWGPAYAELRFSKCDSWRI